MSPPRFFVNSTSCPPLGSMLTLLHAPPGSLLTLLHAPPPRFFVNSTSCPPPGSLLTLLHDPPVLLFSLSLKIVLLISQHVLFPVGHGPTCEI